MIHVLYVPKDKDPLEYYAVAEERGCNQIIHGPSDLVDEHVVNMDEVTVIGIPEYVYLLISKKVVEENEVVNFKFINEFTRELDETQGVFLEISEMYKKDSKKERIQMNHDSTFVYDIDHRFNEYGEFLVRISVTNLHGETVIVCEDEIIVYRASENSDQEENKEVFSFDS